MLDCQVKDLFGHVRCFEHVLAKRVRPRFGTCSRVCILFVVIVRDVGNKIVTIYKIGTFKLCGLHM